MRILFCNPLPISKELGGSKVTVELAEAMSELGWDCTIIGSDDIVSSSKNKLSDWHHVYSEALRNYLSRNAIDYDVVDYWHEYLPYTRNEFSTHPLFVARSVLLAHHMERIAIPLAPTWKARIGNLVKGAGRRSKWKRIIERATRTIQEADLVNVSNGEDKVELVGRGIHPNKIVVIPYGISESRRPLFNAVSSQPPERPIVAFVGSFDYRKGAREFPTIVQKIADNIPNVHFRLLGTAGIFNSKAEVLAHFPCCLRPQIEVIPRFASNELPNYLATCSIGIFPSYIEGMPFGVLEMLAASVPVFAYDSPGPPMMLPSEYLVARGDAVGMSDKVTALLRNPEQLIQARIWAKSRASDFSWRRSAHLTSKLYCAAMAHQPLYHDDSLRIN